MSDWPQFIVIKPVIKKILPTGVDTGVPACHSRDIKTEHEPQGVDMNAYETAMAKLADRQYEVEGKTYTVSYAILADIRALLDWVNVRQIERVREGGRIAKALQEALGTDRYTASLVYRAARKDVRCNW